MNPTSLNPKYNYDSIKTRFTHRFLRTLKQVNSRYLTRSTSSSTSSSSREMYRRSLEIRHAANMSMAATVGSKRAWSRAMLSKIRRHRRLHGQMRRRSVHKFNKENIGNPTKNDSTEDFGGESETQELREIVPGGEDLDMKSLLDETAHYIKCLTTQVQVMKDILHLYAS